MNFGLHNIPVVFKIFPLLTCIKIIMVCWFIDSKQVNNMINIKSLTHMIPYS